MSRETDARAQRRNETVQDLIEAQAGLTPDAPALEAPGRPSLTYRELVANAHAVAAGLTERGVGPGLRIALTLPNGVALPIAAMAIWSQATCAPVDPALSAPELEAAFSLLGVDAVLTWPGGSAAKQAAESLGLPLLTVVERDRDGHGGFELLGAALPVRPRLRGDGSADLALVMHTSGSTARPKVVPISRRTARAVALNVASSLQLTVTDRCLNVMPMYHYHGLMGATIPSLMVGASAYLPERFDPVRFFEWYDACRPTWYTGSPALHQAILEKAGPRRALISEHRLRLIRSSSAALSSALAEELERTLVAPVIVTYGLTEAGGMTAQPLPPRSRKPGSVGVSTGVDLGVMDEDGRLLGPTERGEIVTRGDHVFSGYERDPEATAAAFRDGWFRTGDLGYLDEEGYLFITGRVKDLINRGGVKVSPAEVDETLAQHPAVAAAVTFPVPHPRLGEDVAAAVVLRPGAETTAAEIRAFCWERLGSSRSPRRILIVPEIPTSQTGKHQRASLAAALGVEGNGARTWRAPTGPAGTMAGSPRTENGEGTSVSSAAGGPPAIACARMGCSAEDGSAEALGDDLERALSVVWQDALGVGPIGLDEDFFDVGGDSLTALRLVQGVERSLGRGVPDSLLFRTPTIRQMARYLLETSRPGHSTDHRSSLVSIQPRGSRPPFFWAHAVGGHVLCYRNLSRYLGDEQPVFALEASGLDGKRAPLRRIEEMARRYVSEIVAAYPEGPCYLGGLSFGGLVALEMARELRARGREVALLVLLDTTHPRRAPALRTGATLRDHASQRLDFHRGNLTGLPLAERAAYVGQRLGILWTRLTSAARAPRGGADAGDAPLVPWATRRVEAANRDAAAEYEPGPYSGRAVLFRASKQGPGYDGDPCLGWGDVFVNGLDVRETPGHHSSIIVEPHVRVLGEQLRLCLRAAQTDAAG